METILASSQSAVKHRELALDQPDAIIIEYLEANEPRFKELRNLKIKGWQNAEGDRYYERKRQSADNADKKRRYSLYKMSQQIAAQLHAQTNIFDFGDSMVNCVQALFLCMAPGGYTKLFLSVQPDARISGVTLPETNGGHPMILPYGDADPRVDIKFLDITMLAREFCNATDALPRTHLGNAEFSDTRLFEGNFFDLVVCDGQVLRTHQRHESRNSTEATRLMTAQLILGMQRIKPGGRFIMLLHKVEAIDTVKLLHEFNHFSRIRLFKPKPMQAQHSSFYLVAESVQPTHNKAIEAIKRWKKSWWNATFGLQENDENRGDKSQQEDEARELIHIFGARLRTLGNPIWEIQRKALKAASYTQ